MFEANKIPSDSQFLAMIHNLIIHQSSLQVSYQIWVIQQVVPSTQYGKYSNHTMQFHYVVCSTQYVVCSTQYVVSSGQYIVCSRQYAVPSRQYVVGSIQYLVCIFTNKKHTRYYILPTTYQVLGYYILPTMYYILCTTYYVLHTMYYIL